MGDIDVTLNPERESLELLSSSFAILQYLPTA
jgi:hypothetical protein